MSNKIPTAEEFYKSIVGNSPSEIDQHSCTLEVIQGFAKLHVEAALKAAADRAEIEWDLADVAYVKQESILNAYPLTNIK